MGKVDGKVGMDGEYVLERNVIMVRVLGGIEEKMVGRVVKRGGVKGVVVKR